jgi:hypothetical protein
VLRLSIRAQLKESGKVGLIYKIQTATVVIISFVSGTTLNYLFAQTATDWLFQYIPTIICVVILVVWQRVKVHNAT